MQTRIRLRDAMPHGCLLALVWLACAWLPLYAGTPQAAPIADPPLQVARVSWLAGEVSLLPAGASQWQAVDLNLPLRSGDELATGANARVELQLGSAVAHLANHTDFSLLALGEWQTQLALTQGTVELDVRALPDGEYVEIDTPQVAVVVDRSARVRVDLGTGAASTVTVRRGTVVVHGDHGAKQVLHAGERYRFASPVLSDAVALTYGSGDAFARWARSREMLYANSGSGQYVAPGTVGYRDLDRYGQWSSEPEYGEVWFPNDVAVGWVPYRNGRWVWIAPWGMTWVSNEPWGFAPFHYGRWARIGSRWGWVPGLATVRAVYAPALVGFFGGSGWSVSVGVAVGAGSLVGWYPLAPGMIYDPWYRVDWGYYSRVNRWYRHARRRHHHHERVREAYNAWRKPQLLRHMRFLGQPPHGITVVSRKAVAGGHDVAQARLHVADSHLRKAPKRFRGLDIKSHPVRNATWHPGRVATIKAARPVVALHRPPKVAVDVRRHEDATSPVRRKAPVRLLTAGTRSRARPAHRPLPSHLFTNPSAHSGTPAVQRQSDSTAARITKFRSSRAARLRADRPPGPVVRTPQGRSSGKVARKRKSAPVATAERRHTPTLDVRSASVATAPVRRHNPKLDATLPRVLHLQVPKRAQIAERSSLPHVTRSREARPASTPPRHADVFTAPTPRARRPAVRVRRPASTPAWHAPTRRASPVRRAAPVHRYAAPTVREPRHAAQFHVTSRPVSHRTRSVKHSSKSKDNSSPPPIRIH